MSRTIDYSDLTDAELAERIRGAPDRPRAFEELLVGRYEKLMIFWFHQCGTDFATAQDLTQDLLKKLWENGLGNFDPAVGEFPGFLKTAVIHLWIEKVGRRRRPECSTIPESWPSQRDEQQELHARELEARIRKAVAQLRGDQRPVMELAIDGTSRNEIAARLGMSVERVDKVLWQARKSLAMALNLTLPRSSRGRPPGSKAKQSQPPTDV